MKRILLTAIAGLLFILSATAQDNVVGAYGWVGIGTTGPVNKLTVSNGNVQIRYGQLIVSDSSNNPDFDYARIEKVNNGGWLNFTIAGASGIGSGGPGHDAWIGYSNVDGAYFDNAKAKDICYRNLNGGLLFGNTQASPGMIVKNNKVGIGVLNPQERLSVVGNYVQTGDMSVNGNITSKKLKITQTGWADYVFEPSYKLLTLKEVEEHIAKYKHLPDVPSARQVEDEGVDVGSGQATLLRKIEELTLYVIEQNKQIAQQQQRLEELERKLSSSKRQ